MALMQKLYNGEISPTIIENMITASSREYVNLTMYSGVFSQCQTRKLLDFISDDTYEFNSILTFAQTMIHIGINTQQWIQIVKLINNYNNTVRNNDLLFKMLYVALDNPITQADRNFIKKMLKSRQKRGYSNTNYTKIQKINEKIEQVERNLLYNDLNDLPVITLKSDQINDIPSEFLVTFYDKDNDVYNIKIDSSMYTVCHKYITQSSIRKLVDDAVYQKYSNDIPKLAYLFAYRSIRSKLLDYKSHIETVTNHTPEYIINTLVDTVKNLDDRCTLELSTLSNLKKESEGSSELKSWDIAHYVNKWRLIYGINEEEIAEYFEINNTLTKIFEFISKMFNVTFSQCNKYNKWSKDIMIFTIKNQSRVIGELTLDLFARDGKCPGTRTVCINTPCLYPHAKGIAQPANVIVSLFLAKCTPTLLTINDLHKLFVEFGKTLFHIFSMSSYSIFGGMNAHLEHVDAMGKFLDLCLFEPSMLKFISRHYKNKTSLSDDLAKKINKQLKLDNGISYKYQCMYGSFDLFVHSNQEFIDKCRKLMNIQDTKQRTELITTMMYSCYNGFYRNFFSTNIDKDVRHFHPIKWSYLFNGNENINFLKILTDMYAYELYSKYKRHTSPRTFCLELVHFIESISDSDTLQYDKFILTKPSVSAMFGGMGLDDNDSILSLYNVDVSKEPENKSHIKPQPIPSVKPNTSQLNYYIELSENDPEVRKILGEIMK